MRACNIIYLCYQVVNAYWRQSKSLLFSEKRNMLTEKIINFSHRIIKGRSATKRNIPSTLYLWSVSPIVDHLDYLSETKLVLSDHSGETLSGKPISPHRRPVRAGQLHFSWSARNAKKCNTPRMKNSPMEKCFHRPDYRVIFWNGQILAPSCLPPSHWPIPVSAG